MLDAKLVQQAQDQGLYALLSKLVQAKDTLQVASDPQVALDLADATLQQALDLLAQHLDQA